MSDSEECAPVGSPRYDFSGDHHEDRGGNRGLLDGVRGDAGRKWPARLLLRPSSRFSWVRIRCTARNTGRTSEPTTAGGNVFPYIPTDRFDICLYDIAAKLAGQPLYQFLGAFRDKVPVYASSFVLTTPEAYARQADGSERPRLAWLTNSILQGKLDFDIAAYRACREAVSTDFKLMADPVAALFTRASLSSGARVGAAAFLLVRRTAV